MIACNGYIISSYISAANRMADTTQLIAEHLSAKASNLVTLNTLIYLFIYLIYIVCLHWMCMT